MKTVSDRRRRRLGGRESGKAARCRPPAARLAGAAAGSASPSPGPTAAYSRVFGGFSEGHTCARRRWGSTRHSIVPLARRIDRRTGGRAATSNLPPGRWPRAPPDPHHRRRPRVAPRPMPAPAGCGLRPSGTGRWPRLLPPAATGPAAETASAQHRQPVQPPRSTGSHRAMGAQGAAEQGTYPRTTPQQPPYPVQPPSRGGDAGAPSPRARPRWPEPGRFRPAVRGLHRGGPSRRRDCHVAAPPSTFSRCFNMH